MGKHSRLFTWTLKTPHVVRGIKREIRQTGKGNVRTKAETGVTQSQAKKCHQPPEAGEARNEYSELWGKCGPCNTLISAQ